MATTLPDFDDAPSDEPSLSAVSWSAVIAGAVSAAALTVVLMFLGSGLGLTMVSPWTNQGVGIDVCRLRRHLDDRRAMALVRHGRLHGRAPARQMDRPPYR